MSEQRKIRVAVVFGGRGPEHAVSCMGGGNMLASIDRSQYDVVPVGITTAGNWVQVADDPSGSRVPAASCRRSRRSPAGLPGRPVGQPRPPSKPPRPGQIPHLLGEVDVVLPVLHGPYGEDGTIQGLLEMAGIRYVGSGVLASAVSMDKEYMKLIFKANGPAVGPYVVVQERDWPAGRLPRGKRVQDEIAELGWPLFVKPARGGSSIGTSKATTWPSWTSAIAHARQYDPKVLVEAAIDGAEIEVLGARGDRRRAAGHQHPRPAAHRRRRGVLGLRGQVPGHGQRHGDPGADPAARARRSAGLAAAAFDAVSCEGLARVDFFYTPDGQILINEINTMPGLSPASYFQKMWEASGLPFTQLIDRLLRRR